MGNRSAFILVPETLESHGILGNGRPAVSVRRLPGSDSAACRVACRVPRAGESVATTSPTCEVRTSTGPAIEDVG